MFISFNADHLGLDLPLEEAADLARRHGFEGLDFAMPEAKTYADTRSAQALLEVFASRGLRVGHWNLPFCPYRRKETWQAGMESLMDQARLAECIGATRASMWILPGCDERAFDANFRFHVERFKPIAELLAAANIRLGLEFIGPLTSRSAKAHEFVHTLEGMVELARAVGPNVGLLLDSWHWHTSGATVEDLLSLSGEQVVHVHVNDAPAGVSREEQIDNRRRMPGTTGVIDIAGFLGALERIGYDGPVTAEPFDEEARRLPPERRGEWNAQCLRDVMGRAGLAENPGT